MDFFHAPEKALFELSSVALAASLKFGEAKYLAEPHLTNVKNIIADLYSSLYKELQKGGFQMTKKGSYKKLPFEKIEKAALEIIEEFKQAYVMTNPSRNLIEEYDVVKVIFIWIVGGRSIEGVRKVFGASTRQLQDYLGFKKSFVNKVSSVLADAEKDVRFRRNDNEPDGTRAARRNKAVIALWRAESQVSAVHFLKRRHEMLECDVAASKRKIANLESNFHVKVQQTLGKMGLLAGGFRQDDVAFIVKPCSKVVNGEDMEFLDAQVVVRGAGTKPTDIRIGYRGFSFDIDHSALSMVDRRDSITFESESDCEPDAEPDVAPRRNRKRRRVQLRPASGKRWQR